MTADTAIDIRGLDKDFGGFALRDLHLTVPTGYVMGLVGPNGAGKTTTIKCLLGMLRPDRGEISVLGRATSSSVAELRQGIGVVLDTPYYVRDWRVADVERALRPFYPAWDTGSFAELCRRFALPADRKVKDLSRGMGMKLMITVALSHHASLLILDEPTSGLDPLARDELLGVLGEFMTDESHSVLFSTHITGDLAKIADYITFIRDGQVLRSGTTEQVLTDYVLVRGGPDQMPESATLLGLRRHAQGFEALLPAAQASHLSPGLVIEQPTLDEIVVHLAKEES